jgi:DNA polymerase III subunit delta
MEEAKRIVQEVENRKIRPIYFLCGEEPYYIDKTAEFLEASILTESEKAFNQLALYGRETTIEEIVSHARRYPMMAEKQVIVVREGQHLSRTIEKFLGYAENPQRSTVLVVCYKYKSLDKRKKLYKAILSSGGMVLDSKPLYENQVADWIRKFLNGKGCQISPGAAALLVDYLGADLSRISNELSKLQLVLAGSKVITPELIEEHIGISKDYNNFELRKAVGARDLAKVARIMNYFGQNPKDHPFVVTISAMHSFFTQILQYHGLSDHSSKNVAGVLRINSFFVPEYQAAAKNYSMKKASLVISGLRQLDLKGKGVGAPQITHQDLLKELLVQLN